MRKIILLNICAGLALSGCAAVFNGEEVATRSEERHPITVDQQTISIRVPIDPTLAGLSRESLAQLDAFLTSYRTRGHGPVTITAPSAGDNGDLDGQQTAAQVRAALNAFGLQYEDMQGATYRTASRDREVIVSFTQYVASAPSCGSFSGNISSRLRNLPAPNFGCANQANFAAMVADPHDLTTATEMAPVIGEMPASAIRSVISGANSYSDKVAVGGLGEPAGGSSE